MSDFPCYNTIMLNRYLDQLDHEERAETAINDLAADLAENLTIAELRNNCSMMEDDQLVMMTENLKVQSLIDILPQKEQQQLLRILENVAEKELKEEAEANFDEPEYLI